MQWWCVAQGVPWTWTWRAYPGVWLFVAALVGAYGWLLRGQPVRGGPATWRKAAFGAGAVTLWVALDWPVGALGAGYLASVHMVQFLLIALVAPPLLLLGLPPDALRRFAGEGRRAGAIRVVTRPLAAIALFSVTLAWTHWPPVVDAWMRTQIGSFGLDMAWLLSGLVLWWPVVSPEPGREWFGYPVKMGYLILGTIVNTGVFAYLTFSELPLYATYELAPPVSWLTTREDQILAGLLMKIGGALILWTAVSVLFALWYRESHEEEGEAREGTSAPGALLLLALLLAVGACGGRGEPALRAGDLELSRVVAPEPVTGERTAIYLRIRSRGDPDTLAGVDAGALGRASLHESRRSDAGMTMGPASGVPVPSGGVVELRPGGYHVMVEGLARPLAAGDSVAVTLRFARTGAVEVRALVVLYAALDSLFP